MKIGLVVPGFSADVSDWCIPALRQLVVRLAAGDRVRVIALRYPYRAHRYGLFGADVIALGGGVSRGAGSLGLWGSFLATLAAEQRREGFDLLHAFWAGETGALTAIAGRILGVPTIVSLAGGEMVGLPDIAYGGRLAATERWKTDLALSLARIVTVGSRYLMRQAAGGTAGPWKDRLRLAPLGVDTDLFRPNPPSDSRGCFRLVQAASLVPVKGQEALLRAVSLLRDDGLPVQLEIAGQGALDGALRRLAGELGIGNAVCLLGEQPYPRLPEFYNGAALYLQSSRHEAQGMAVLEAAACGVPMVGTDVGVLPELSPEAAVSVPVGDHHALADAVSGLLRDPDRRLAMATAARRLIEAQFGLDRTVQTFRSLYSKLAQ